MATPDNKAVPKVQDVTAPEISQARENSQDTGVVTYGSFTVTRAWSRSHNNGIRSHLPEGTG